MVKGAEKISYQQSFTDMEYNNRKRKTKIKREEFLEAMDYLIHLEEWVERVEPCYLSEKMRTGRHAVCFISDGRVEEAMYDSYGFRKFIKIVFFNK